MKTVVLLFLTAITMMTAADAIGEEVQERKTIQMQEGEGEKVQTRERVQTKEQKKMHEMQQMQMQQQMQQNRQMQNQQQMNRPVTPASSRP
jgi:hypothetical protein